MNSAPHLSPEDHLEFERVLHEALRTADRRPDLAAIGQRLNVEQLRTMALAAAATIAACADAEYRHYVAVREALRESAPAGRAQPLGVAELRFGGAARDAAEAAGAGLIAVFAVLAPVLAGTAAAIFLLAGYTLRVISPEPAIAGPLRTAGWLFAGLAAAGIVLAMVGLLLTALRNGASAVRASADQQRSLSEVAKARDAWREALLERGVLPFLREALAEDRSPAQDSSPAGDAEGAAYGAYGPYEDEDHAEPELPHLGYTRPGFSSPAADDQQTARPSFHSPGYTSPEFGGPDHDPG